ncbi:ricin-type beta-trefoil lectin domain protein, partial [Phycicoccus sp. CSK15P-2]|uniref:ricin-type beta-trefoil lectin domain protein n=1 Tax=Phycicoccus sp. CSK15P-2 TaxID=2807627 RepID=UPI0019521A21
MRTARLWRAMPRLLLIASVAVAGHLVTAGDVEAAPTPDGWTQVWAEDFDGAAGAPPDASRWIVDTGTSYPGGPANWGTGEKQVYTSSPSNLGLDGGGNLKITALRDSGGTWTSARIESRRSNLKPADGGVLRIEGRIRMPNVTGAAAAGYWPAFWTLGSPYRGNYQNWPGIGEFDIMENVNGINTVWGVLHCGTAPNGPCNEFEGLGGSRTCPGAACQGNFHTYAVEWDRSTSPNELRWYVDGQQFHRVTADQVGSSAWSQMTSHEGYFVLLNLAMGGSFPDAVQGSATPTSATQPGHYMLVDYVAAYTRGGGGNPPPPSGGGVAVVSDWNGKCLDVPNRQFNDGQRVQMYTCNQTVAQKWTFANGRVESSNGKCLDVAGGATADGTPVQIANCSSNAAQKWVLSSAGDLVNPQANKCLDIKDWVNNNGAQLQIWT